MEPNCVIIIPFVSLNNYVIQCVQECLKLDYSNYGLVLLPDISEDLPSELQSDRITVVVTGDCTIAAKRNAAIKKFPNADYFALVDSDAYPDRKWLKNGVAFLSENPDVWAVGGPNITPPEEPQIQRVVGYAQRSFLVSGPLYFAKQISSSRYCSNLHSCNLILPGSMFEVVGLFDENLFVGEDRNLCERIKSHGKRIYFNRSILVYHHNRRLWLPFFFQRLTYGHGSVNKKNLYKYNILQFIPIMWVALFIIAMLDVVFDFIAGFPVVWFIIMNFALVLIEAVRSSDSKRDVPGTLAAILVCFIGTAIGQIIAVAGVRLDLKKIYSNNPVEL